MKNHLDLWNWKKNYILQVTQQNWCVMLSYRQHRYHKLVNLEAAHSSANWWQLLYYLTKVDLLPKDSKHFANDIFNVQHQSMWKKGCHQPGSCLVWCLKCRRSMIIDNCTIQMNINFNIETDGKNYSVNAFLKVINDFLSENIYSYGDNTTMLEENLLLLENIDIQLSRNKTRSSHAL